MSKDFALVIQLKDVLRRELEKAEQEVRRSSGIIADYKQVFMFWEIVFLLKDGRM